MVWSTTAPCMPWAGPMCACVMGRDKCGHWGRYLHSAQQGHGGGVVDDALAEDQAVQQRRAVGAQHLPRRQPQLAGMSCRGGRTQRPRTRQPRRVEVSKTASNVSGHPIQAGVQTCRLAPGNALHGRGDRAGHLQHGDAVGGGEDDAQRQGILPGQRPRLSLPGTTSTHQRHRRTRRQYADMHAHTPRPQSHLLTSRKTRMHATA